MTYTDDLYNQNRTYESLSQEFKELYPMARRAFDLIPMMYDRLTLIDKMSHSDTITKIYQDHTDLEGFSRRNIYRFLPLGNPNVPRRVVPRRHKSNSIKYVLQSSQDNLSADTNYLQEGSSSYEELKQKNYELELALEESTKPVSAAKFTPFIKKYQVPKDKHDELSEAIKKSINFLILEFDNRDNLISAIADT